MVERVVVGAWKTNCYIYSSTKKECIIIDPGGDEAEIATRVDVLNMVPVGIALTHGHVDHVAALARLVENYGRRGYTLPVAICPADRRFLGTGGMETHRESLEVLGLDEMSFFGVDPAELPKANVRLRDGEQVFNMDIVVLETPGHTPGSVCFYAEKEGILFSGDTLFFDGVGRTDLPGGSDRKLRESIQKKIAVLPPETRVFPGHGPFTTVEREKRGNLFFRVPPAPPRPEPAKPAVKTQPRSAAVRKAARHAARPASGRKPAGAAKAAGKTGRAKGGARKAANASARAASRRPRPSRPAPRRSPVRPKARKALRPAAARRKASARSAGAAARARAVQAKAGKGVKRKARQATRSTKAPGKGRKPAR
jgi:hydroxyacylglutathione hydrolase